MMSKGKLKLLFLISFSVFLTMLATMAVIIIITFALVRCGIIRDIHPQNLLLLFALMSLSVGTILTCIVIRKMLHPLLEMNEAAQKMAKGDFSVRVSEGNLTDEINAMAHSINVMAQELAGMETFRTDFISNVSHEFKTPLSAIEGYAMLLQDRALSPDKRQTYIFKILYNTKRLSTLTGNILLLSRLENQEINNSQETFSLDEQLRQTILLFETEWTQKELELDIDLESVDLYGNPALLAHVWQNLIQNAIKFTPAHGSIGIRLTQQEGTVQVVISDSGIGMSQQVLSHIFDRFYQADPAHSTQGNGLGLTLTKRIVLLHNGYIEVKSEEGRGTAFTVTLPSSDKS